MHKACTMLDDDCKPLAIGHKRRVVAIKEEEEEEGEEQEDVE